MNGSRTGIRHTDGSQTDGRTEEREAAAAIAAAAADADEARLRPFPAARRRRRQSKSGLRRDGRREREAVIECDSGARSASRIAPCSADEIATADWKSAYLVHL